MMSKAKKTLVITALSLGGLMLFGFKKYKTAKEVMKNIKVGVKSISNIDFSLKHITFNVVFTLQNLTKIDFGATLSTKIVVKQIRVYNAEGIILGKADTDFYQLDLPSTSVSELPEATFNLSLDKALEELMNNTDTYMNNDFSNLNFKIDVEVFGNIITLEP